MNIVVVIVVALVAVIATGVLYELIATARDRKRFQTPVGTLIDVGGHRLHAQITGTRNPNQPVIVLDAGVGSGLLDWQLVQPRLAEFTQVVSYDRAGYGWSDRGSDPRTSERIVEELHQLLVNADIKPPYLLVGHSFGGVHVRLFTERYPQEVAGIAFIESSHPDMIAARNTEPELRRLRNVSIFKRLGLVRWMLPKILTRANVLPTDARQQYLAMNLKDSDNVLREATPLFTQGVKLSDHIDKPIVILSRQFDEDLQDERTWHEYQMKLVELSPMSHHIESEKNSHFLALSDPDTVVLAIQTLFDTIKQEMQ